MSGLGFIAEQLPEVCDMCGNIDECRPYGPNDENICYNCGMEKVDRVVIEQKMAEYIFGEKK